MQILLDETMIYLKGPYHSLQEGAGSLKKSLVKYLRIDGQEHIWVSGKRMNIKKIEYIFFIANSLLNFNCNLFSRA